MGVNIIAVWRKIEKIFNVLYISNLNINIFGTSPIDATFLPFWET